MERRVCVRACVVVPHCAFLMIDLYHQTCPVDLLHVISIEIKACVLQSTLSQKIQMPDHISVYWGIYIGGSGNPFCFMHIKLVSFKSFEMHFSEMFQSFNHSNKYYLFSILETEQATVTAITNPTWRWRWRWRWGRARRCAQHRRFTNEQNMANEDEWSISFHFISFFIHITSLYCYYTNNYLNGFNIKTWFIHF